MELDEFLYHPNVGTTLSSPPPSTPDQDFGYLPCFLAREALSTVPTALEPGPLP